MIEITAIDRDFLVSFDQHHKTALYPGASLQPGMYKAEIVTTLIFASGFKCDIQPPTSQDAEDLKMFLDRAVKGHQISFKLVIDSGMIEG